MADQRREFIYARATLAVASAARNLGIFVDLDCLAPSLSGNNPEALVRAEEHLAVCQAIYQDPRETLGIDMAQTLPLEVTGLWGFLLRSSSTFGDMLRRAERYMRIVNKYSEFVLEERGSHTAMLSPHPDPSPYGPREQIVCTLLGHWISWGRQLTHQALSIREARFRWLGPSNREPFEHFFQAPVVFGATEDLLILDSDTLAIPMLESTPELSVQFEAYASTLIRRLAPQNDFVERVREAVAEGLLNGASQKEDIAKRLAITVRTMHRRLDDAGTSFRKLRDELLRERAEKLLREGQVSIGEVAYLLGYGEPSNFHRAFRRWTGITPAAWRDDHPI